MSIPVAIRTKAALVMEGYEGLAGLVPKTGRYIPYEGKADRKGIFTIGRGHVLSREEKTTRKIKVAGASVDVDFGLTLAQVDQLFEQDARSRYARFSGWFEGETDDQMAAILSSGYNYEAMWWDGTAGRCFRKKDLLGTARGMLMITMSNGKHQLGLWRRRMSEVLLFLTGKVMIAKDPKAEQLLFNELKKAVPDLQAIRNRKFPPKVK